MSVRSSSGYLFRAGTAPLFRGLDASTRPGLVPLLPGQRGPLTATTGPAASRVSLCATLPRTSFIVAECRRTGSPRGAGFVDEPVEAIGELSSRHIADLRRRGAHPDDDGAGGRSCLGL